MTQVDPKKSTPASLEEAQALIRKLRSEIEDEKERRVIAQNNERCFRELAEHIPEVIWMTNRSGDELVYVCPAYEHIWGEKTEKLYENPRHRLECVHKDDRKRVLDAFQRDAAAGRYDEVYRIHRADDGEIRWIRDRAYPVNDDHGELYRLAGLALDITDGVHNHDRLNELHTRLDTHERLSVFAALGTGLAHDLSQPLTAARNFIASVRRNAKDTAHDAPLARADAEIERAVHIIRHLRDFAREGQPSLTVQPLQPIIDDVHQLMDPLMRSHGVHYHGPHPDTVDRVELPLDRIFVQQMLRNLISNAADASEQTAADERHITVRVQADSSDSVDIAVEDNGSGIADGVDLFEPFITTKDQGLGLGLAVSRSLARSHGGDLLVDSRGGNGAPTRFVLRLPRV